MINTEVTPLTLPSSDMLDPVTGRDYWDRADIRIVLDLNGASPAIQVRDAVRIHALHRVHQPRPDAVRVPPASHPSPPEPQSHPVLRHVLLPVDELPLPGSRRKKVTFGMPLITFIQLKTFGSSLFPKKLR